MFINILKERDFTVYNYNTDYYIQLIRERLSEKRYVHSLNVADSAKQLAEIYGTDSDKAYLSGILHDIMKEEKDDIQLYYMNLTGEKIEKYTLDTHAVHHQISGAAFCKAELKINDADIISPIRFHTTGHENMTMEEKILFTADLISADREYPDVNVMRSKAVKNIDDAVLYAISYTVNDLINKGSYIHPDTIGCYNSILYDKKRKGLINGCY